MRKGLQQIRCSSDVSIAGRIGSRLQTQGHHPQKMRDLRGLWQDQEPEMVTLEDDEAVHPHLGEDIGIPLRGKDVLHLLLAADVVPLLHQDVADLPLPLLGAGLLHHLLVDVLHPPDATLRLSSVATAPHLCPLRRGDCLVLLQDAPLQGPNDDSPDHPSVEVPHLKGDAPLHPQHLHPDTGGAHCHLLADQEGIHGHLFQLPVACLPPQQTVVVLLGVQPVLVDVLKPPVHPHWANEDSRPRLTVVNPYAECPAPLSHATAREAL